MCAFLSPEISAAVAVAIDYGCPFALYRLPSSTDAVFMANPSGEEPAYGCKSLLVQPFEPSLPPYRIYGECDAGELSALASAGRLVGRRPLTGLSPAPQPTPRAVYERGLSSLIAALRRGEGGKVVISRVKTVVAPGLDRVLLADALFDAFPQAFCFCYYIPALGLWLGASPELLLRRDAGRLYTMALAGTRPAGSSGRWDEKNLDEHRVVVDFIVEAFRNCGLKAETGATCTLPYGRAIEHLCTPVSAAATADFDRVLAALHPTPALCGYPRDFAMAAIRRTENHDRACYGGYIVVDGAMAYVNLRCARIYADGTCCLFVGGGIMPESDPFAEWDETERKASTLISLIEKCRY